MMSEPQRITSRRDVPARRVVADSWRRSAAAGVDADRLAAPLTLPERTLRDARAAHPLATVFPLLDDVVGRAARDCGVIMAVADDLGQLLWVCGSPRVLRDAESIGFVEGSNWDERMAGTNAPGLAIKLDRTTTVLGAEHFRRSVRQWSCTATPIHDPQTNAVLGVLDITGRDEIATPQTVAMLRSAAHMAESELARQLVSPRAQLSPRGSLHVLIESLGRFETTVTIQDGRSAPTRMRLSRRHSEIVLLLAAAPRGLSGDELAVQLYHDDNAESTLRAELNRLRNLFDHDVLVSRPYRLKATVTGDWLAVEDWLAAGDVVKASRAYKGPLLPGSDAPGVVRLRDRVANSLRYAIIRSGSFDLMSHWTRSWWGCDDYDMWVAQYAATDPSSPFLPLVAGQIERLDRELGVGERHIPRR